MRAVFVEQEALARGSHVPDRPPSRQEVQQTPRSLGAKNSDECDGDVDQNLNGKTFAIKAQPGSNPIELVNANARGATDATDPIDSFPKSTPFQGAQGTGKLMWFTTAPRRAPGLRSRGATQQLLWMFAIDPAKVLAGGDGSYRGFFLPFQDLTTSNHIALWTEKIVGGSAPPPPHRRRPTTATAATPPAPSVAE